MKPKVGGASVSGSIMEWLLYRMLQLKQTTCNRVCCLRMHGNGAVTTITRSCLKPRAALDVKATAASCYRIHHWQMDHDEHSTATLHLCSHKNWLN